MNWFTFAITSVLSEAAADPAARVNATATIARRTWFSLMVVGEPYSEVVGSIIPRTWETLLAGKPPICACFRTVASSGAMYTQ